MKTVQRLTTLFLCVLFLASCQQATPTTPPSFFSDEELNPYATSTLTPTVTATPQNAPTSTLAPTMTSTPITYTVKSDETMFEIAANYGLTTDEIKAANPSVNPYLLKPGMTLIIPAAKGVTPTQNSPASTPYPMSVSNPQCTPSLSGGLYCFAEVTNGQELMVENISAEFQLTDSASGEVTAQKALVPLTRIASGSNLPIFAYFPPPVAASSTVSLKMLTTMSVNQNGTPTPIQAATITIVEPEIIISANGLSAVVNAQASLESTAGVNGKIWVAAAAYDAQGNIVGIRRFESASASNPGESVSFSLNIYSIGGKIERVELFGEANP